VVIYDIKVNFGLPYFFRCLNKQVAIAGGGLAGLLAALALARQGARVVLIEKKTYPFHRVCGEYISNETIPYLRSLDAFPEAWRPAQITTLQLTSVNGRAAHLPLDLGGFGVSRFVFDHFLAGRVVQEGGHVKQGCEIEKITFDDEQFHLSTTAGDVDADVVIGSFGKRSKLDYTLHRQHVRNRSPYAGIKYHVKINHPEALIALHNFKDGYCGISRVEADIVNLCYLTHQRNLRQYKDVRTMEEQVLFRNPFLKQIFTGAHFLFEKPEVINEISFATKQPVESHILMAGDAAGMITPLCGNGMALAIHSAKVVSEWVLRFCRNEISRDDMEQGYATEWRRRFAARLWAGRQIQNLFGSEAASNAAVNLARYGKPVANFLIRQTHGQPF
jgi:flavin-dependent dehydrogenase